MRLIRNNDDKKIKKAARENHTDCQRLGTINPSTRENKAITTKAVAQAR